MKYRQNKQELINHLKEQICFLISSSMSFDRGHKEEAKRLAATLRLLLHDTERQISLLKQLGKKQCLFYDTACEYNPKNMVPTMGLIAFSTCGYVALLDNLPEARSSKKVSFDYWWKDKIVFDDKQGNLFTRKDLICFVANQDGGTHVDPKLNKSYADLTRFNSLGWNIQINRNGENIEVESNPVLISIRQIAHEVLKTLKYEFPNILN